MERVIQTIVEDAPKDMFLIASYYHEKRKDDNGNRIKCADLLRPYKKVNLFYSDGEMEVKYYTESEWNDTERYCGIDRKPGLIYHPGYLDCRIFLAFLNNGLEYVGIQDEIQDIIDGNSVVKLEQLTEKSRQLVEYVQKWDCTTPFQFGAVYQTAEEEEDGVTYYEVECFKVL